MPPTRPSASGLALLLIAAIGCSDSENTTGGSQLLRVALDGSGDYTSIQAAVDAASAGTTIQIAAGIYSEQVVVAKSVALFGAGSGTVVQDLSPQNPMPDDSTDDSTATILVRDTVDVVIRALRVKGPEDGIQVRNAARVVVEEVDASNNGDEGIDVRSSETVLVSGAFDGNADTGILVREGSFDVTVANCTADSNDENGIRVRESSSVFVEACTAGDNGDDGIEVRDSATVEIRQSTIEGNDGYGIRVGGTSGFVQLNNTIGGNLLGNVHFD